MTTYEELNLKRIYDSKHIDVYHEFFNKVLPQTSMYCRFGGLFSSENFAYCAEGLQDFIKINRGKMQLSIIPIFSDDEKNAIHQGISVEKVIIENWIKDLSEIKEKFVEDHVKALAWMISRGDLEIKIILPKHGDGTLLTKNELKKLDIFKKHIGIMYNKDNQKCISFHGEINRENTAIEEKYQLEVYREWIENEEPIIQTDNDKFNNFWNKKDFSFEDIHIEIKPIPEALKNYFTEFATNSEQEIPNFSIPSELREYQKIAITKWLENGGSGIFEMATGTGKTFTAIGCIKSMQEKHERLLVIIAVPYDNLLDQWKKELLSWNIDSKILGKTWSKVLRDIIYDFNKSKEENFQVLLTTHAKLSTSKFIEEIEKMSQPIMLVADEAHHFGAFNSQRALSKNYTYRLALSATISRYFDDDGTDYLIHYFKGTVFTYSLQKAIENKFLCGYNYYPYFVNLTEDETVEWKKITNRIAQLYSSKDETKRQQGKALLITRSRIIKNAENKIDAFKDILSAISKIKLTLIFCTEKQNPVINNICLDAPKHVSSFDQSIMAREITFENPSDPKERGEILKDFANEKWDALFSNKVLDEGMDIPQAKTCIILASSGNPSQFIQRRGRVLRNYKELYKDGTKKTHADIYDILVKPELDNNLSPELLKTEIQIIRNQYSRIKEMSELAINKKYCIEKIKEFRSELPEDVIRNT